MLLSPTIRAPYRSTTRISGFVRRTTTICCSHGGPVTISHRRRVQRPRAPGASGDPPAPRGHDVGYPGARAGLDGPGAELDGAGGCGRRFPAGSSATPERCCGGWPKSACAPSRCTRHWSSGEPVPGRSGRNPSSPWKLAVREEFLDQAEKDPGRGLPLLRNQLVLAGRGVLAADRQHVGVSRQMARWATLAVLARCTTPIAAPNSRGPSAGLLSGSQAGEALRWIEAARRVERFVGPKLSAAIEWAGRQLELAHRREDDERHLTRFYLRKTLLSAFTASCWTVTTSTGRCTWQAGGASARPCSSATSAPGWNADRSRSTARVDFDYLNPASRHGRTRPPADRTRQGPAPQRPDGSGAEPSSTASTSRPMILHERWNTSTLTTQSADDALEDPTYLPDTRTIRRGGRAAAAAGDTAPRHLRRAGEGPGRRLGPRQCPDDLRHAGKPCTSGCNHGRLQGCLHRSAPAGQAQARTGACPRTQLAARPYLRLTEVRGSRARKPTSSCGQEEVPPGLIGPIREHCREPRCESYSCGHWPQGRRSCRRRRSDSTRSISPGWPNGSGQRRTGSPRS